MILNKITPRLLLVFFLLSPLPLAGLAVFYIDSFKHTLEKSQLQNLSSLADKKADEINDYIRARLNTGRMLAKSANIMNALETLSPMFKSAGVNSTSYKNTEGVFRQYFKTLLERDDFYDLLITDLNGNVITSILHEPDFGSNLLTGPDRESSLAQAHRNAVDSFTSQITLAKPYGPSNNKPAIFLVVPIYKAAKVVGTVALQLDLEKLTAVTSDTTGLGNTGETVLAQQTEHGILYVGPLKHIPDAAFHFAVTMTELAQPIFAAIHGVHNKGVALDYANIEVIGAWRYLPALQWGMVVKIDTSEAFASYYLLRTYTFIALGLLVLASVFVAILFGRKLIDPVYQMIDLTREISSGNLDRHVEVEGWYELNQLAKSFNQMTERLRISQNDLEKNLMELTANTERLNAAQKIARIGDYEMDLVGNRLTWSDTMFELFGYEAGSFTPTKEHSLSRMHPDDVGKLSTKIVDAIKHDNTANAGNKIAREAVEYRVIHPDQSLHWLRSDGVIMFDEKGHPIRIRGTVQDITDRKNSEYQMQLAKEEAERASAAKTDFLSRMSHELRTPLNAILGFGQLLQQDPEHPLTQQQTDNMHEIMHGGEHLLALVNEILDLSRIESGQLNVKLEPVLAQAVVESCVNQIHPMAAEHQVSVVFDSDVAHMVMADAVRLREVLFNLLSNAIKYNKKGGKVHVSCALRAEKLRFSVQDSGAGIPVESISRLFRPFERLESAYVGIDGMGIGLALSKRLVEAMQGEIGVESVVGEGSTFWFELPLGEPVSNTVIYKTLKEAAVQKSPSCSM